MRRRPTRFLTLSAAMLLILAACGGGDTSTAPTLPTVNAADVSDSTTTTTEAVDPEEAFQRYSECMREHGVEMPDPNSGENGAVFSIGGDGVDLEAMEGAAAACDPILEDAFGEFEMTPEQQAEILDQELAFAQCMRDNGIDWPDPSGDLSGAVSIELPGDLDPEALNAAMDVCSKDAFGGDGGLFIGTDTP